MSEVTDVDSWQKIVATDWAAIDAFQQRWNELGGPKDAAAFTDRITAEWPRTFYFNPAAGLIAADILEDHDAESCPTQNIRRLHLLAGDHSIIEEGDC